MNKRIILAIVSLLALVNQVSAEDKVTIENFSISVGETKEVSITLDNDVAYAAFQFDLYLPEGLTVTEYSADNTRIPKGTTLEMNKQDAGFYRFVAAAMDLEEIKGNSGSIITIKVMADENLAGGTMTGYFRKVKLSKLDGTGVSYAEMSFPIAVLKKGDANGDGNVDATDIADIVNSMMGKEPENFNIMNADMNGDGVINIADIIQITNQILSKE